MAEVRCLFAFQLEVPPYTCKRHRHSCTEIVFNFGGSGALFHGTESFEYDARSVFTYQPGEEHWTTQRRKGVHLCLGVEGCHASEIQIGSFPVSAELLTLARTTQRALANGPRDRVRVELLAGLIALDLSERHGKNANRSLAQRAREMIDAEYHRPLTIAGIAARLRISPDYLRQVFRKEFGEGPMRYLSRKRIEAATELLRFSTHPVQYVAEQCGFDNPFYFSRLFRKMCGQTPSSLRPGRSSRAHQAQRNTSSSSG